MTTATTTDILASVTTNKCNTFTTAKFAKLNKQCWLTDYEREVQAGEYYHETVKVVAVATLTPEQYDDFACRLLDDFQWLAGHGGHNSHYPMPAGVTTFHGMTEEQQNNWRAASYAVCVAVQCDGRRTLYCNPEGHSYARYVGI